MNGKLQPFNRIVAEKPDAQGPDREQWENEEYHVFLDKYQPPPMQHVKVWELSILRKDHGTVHDWRDLQAIKTALVGEEFEAIELYPAESRVIDVANEAHLFALMTENGKPVTVSIGRIGRREVNSVLAEQRPL